MRIVVRTRYIADSEHLTEAGADVVIAEELESIVQLFGEVLRDYRIAADQIENYEDLARRNGYSALLQTPQAADKSVFRCQPGVDCYDTRTIIIRPQMPLAEKSFDELTAMLTDLKVKSVTRAGSQIETIAPDFIVKPGDELVIGGATESFVRSAALFRAAKESDGEAAPTATTTAAGNGLLKQSQNVGKYTDTENPIKFVPQANEKVCSHLQQIRAVFPSADGCEDCLRTGDVWVHLRICLTCGHTGCCDSSKNKHATAHFKDCAHPLIKSLERGEDWAWCYADETYL
jgi:Trk K+ transport system NAD-binding subunit